MKEEDRSLSVSQMIDYLIKKFSEKEKEKKRQDCEKPGECKGL